MAEYQMAESTTPREKKREHFGYFEEIENSGNYVSLRRWASFGARVLACEGCAACDALEKTLKSLPCVLWVERRSMGALKVDSMDVKVDAMNMDRMESISKKIKNGVCHRTIELLAPSSKFSCCDVYKKGDIIGSLTMPITDLASVFHRVLMSDLRIKAFKPLAHQTAYGQQFGEAAWPKLPRGILLGFGLGSGKTHAALHLALLRGERDLLIVCAVSLIGQWKQSVVMHAPLSPEAPTTEFEIFGYSHFSDAISRDRNLVSGRMAIVDEAHFFKNLNKAALPSIEALRLSTCVQLLTGTPVRNDSRDLDFILVMLGLQNLIPKELEGEAGRGDAAWGKNLNGAAPPDPYGSKGVRRNLLNHLRGRVALYNPEYCEPFEKYAEHYPQIEERVHVHELSWQQTAERFINGGGVSTGSGKSGGLLRHLSIFAAVRDPIDKSVVYSSKNAAVLADIKRVGRFPQVVYSRFKENLLQPLKLLIESELGVKVEQLDGSTPAKMRQPLLNRFNAGKIDVLLICAVGSEGLDLNVQVEGLHILEPQRNVPEAQQIVGRVVRYSKVKRDWANVPKIQVVKYVAKYPLTEPDQSARVFLVNMIMKIPAVVSGFKGRKETFNADAKLIVKYLRECIEDEGCKTDEETTAKRNDQKYMRTRPLDVLLWMASTTVKTPEKFEDEWAVMMGVERPSELRAKAEIVKEEEKKKEQGEKKKRKCEEEERKIMYWKNRELRKELKIEKRKGIEERKAERLLAHKLHPK